MDLSEAVVAGIWYGEGTLRFDVSPKMSHILPKLSIANNDLYLLVFVGGVWEGLSYKVSANTRQVVLNTFCDVVNFAKVILSFPGDGKKRQQLVIFLEEFVPIYEGRVWASGHNGGYSGCTWSREEFLKAMDVVDKIASLKDKKGAKRKYTKDYFVKI